jgi:AAA ATPase domain
VLAGVGGSQRVDGLEAPLIGRDAELHTVKELFHAAAQRRVPRMVVVAGPAGVGKSRLGWEFRKYLEGLAEIAWWHRGRCLSYGDGVAFWALAEMARQRLGIAEEDPVDLAAAKLADRLGRFVPDPSEREYIGARLGPLRHWGRLAEAREQLTAAIDVLRADPDTDAVRALSDLATVEVLAGSPGANRLSAEALIIGQAIGVGDRCRPQPAPGHAGPRPGRPRPRQGPRDNQQDMRWAWPLAARAAHELHDTATTGELLTLLDSYPEGHLAPMLRAERDLARARLAADDGDPAASAAFASAISSLRELSTPYHLGHGLLDCAQHLTRLQETEAAADAVGEARDIAGRLRCQPLLDRAADLAPAAPPVPAHRA